MKEKFGALPYIYPIPIALVGANIAGKPNFSTIGDTGLVGIKPPVIYISLHHNHHTTIGVEQNGTFSLNFPSTDMLTKVDYCGIVSGRDINKAALFNVFYGDITTAPMIDECPVNMECRVIQKVYIQHRCMFIAEVVQTYVTDRYVSHENTPGTILPLEDLDPILYALDNCYYRIGKPIGVGYNAGNELNILESKK